MRTRVLSEEILQQMFVECIINNTDKVSKVAPLSVLSAMGNSVGRIARSAIKDIALIEARLFPDDAHGDYLDEIARNFGISPRFGASESSMYVRLVGSSGTSYIAGTHTFSGNHGIIFDLEESVTLSALGYAYAKVRSVDLGSRTNVPPLSVNKINTVPVGHSYIINEYQSQGGRDIESDDIFRERIKLGSNVAARGTIEFFNQTFQKINNNILRTFFGGINSYQQPILRVLTQNGIALQQSEIDDLVEKSQVYFSLVEQRTYGDRTFGIEVKNVDFYPIDVDFRCDLANNVDYDEIRKNIQVSFSKSIDYRTWTWDTKIEWDDLLQIVKGTNGVKYVADAYFYPKVDILVQQQYFPRFRGFIMRDLNGNIVTDLQGNLNPIYYPNSVDQAFQQTVISSI